MISGNVLGTDLFTELNILLRGLGLFTDELGAGEVDGIVAGMAYAPAALAEGTRPAGCCGATLGGLFRPKKLVKLDILLHYVNIIILRLLTVCFQKNRC